MANFKRKKCRRYGMVKSHGPKSMGNLPERFDSKERKLRDTAKIELATFDIMEEGVLV